MKHMTTVMGVLALLLVTGGSPLFAMVSVCERTPEVRDYLVTKLGIPCNQITETDLTRVKRIALPWAGLSAVKLGDFDNLPRLETLNLKRNHLREFPMGIIAHCPRLRELVILGNEMTRLPDDFLQGNEWIQKVHFFDNAFRTIPEPVMLRFGELKHLSLLDVSLSMDSTSRARLDQMFPVGSQVLVNYN
jgi:Leucine-rich repeat (LRR) protein